MSTTRVMHIGDRDDLHRRLTRAAEAHGVVLSRCRLVADLLDEDALDHDAFLLDWNLGGDHADSVARRLKRQRPDVRVVVIIPLVGPFDLHLGDIDGLVDPGDSSDAILDAMVEPDRPRTS